ncbi:hypothetical protein GCM10010464_22590 [Pseudonocardia yunnanensis]
MRPSTFAGYESNVRLHLIPRIGKRKLARLSVRDVRLMVDAMRADGKNAPSVQYVHATLRTALEHACREEIVPRNVARLVRIETPTPLKSREPLSAEEARKLLAATRGHRLDALWALLLMLGLRRSEACALRWDDVDFAARTLRISKSVHRVDGQLHEMPTKTRRSNRTVHLPPRCLYALATATASSRKPMDKDPAGPGRQPPTSSAPAGAHHSNPATSPACSARSATTTASAASRSTACATPASHCYSRSASTHASSWRSSATAPSR